MRSAQGELCLHVTVGNDYSVHDAGVQDLYEVGELFSLRIDKKKCCATYTLDQSYEEASYSHFSPNTFDLTRQTPHL